MVWSTPAIFFFMKPREKLEQQSIAKLADHELFALILGHGTKKEDIFRMSERILQKFDHDELVNTMNIEKFSEIYHLGKVQSSRLMAVFEIGKRFFYLAGKTWIFRNSDQVFEYLQPMRELQKEHLRGLYLDARYKLIHEETLTIGGLHALQIHPRDIFRPAIEYSAYAIILAHNHPSGDTNPSKEDRRTAQKITEASELLQIPVLDHLVIGKNGYTSLK